MRYALPVLGVVVHRDRVGLDRDPALALEVHVVEDLVAHLLLRERARDVEEAIGQRRLPVVDVGDDAEVPDERRDQSLTGAPPATASWPSPRLGTRVEPVQVGIHVGVPQAQEQREGPPPDVIPLARP